MPELRPPQQQAIDKSYEWFRTKSGDPLISMATGVGKGKTIAQICSDSQKYKNQHVLVVVHSKELVEQDFLELRELCPEIHAGIYCAGLGKKQIRNVTFASIQSICKIKQTPFFDLVIIDEVQAVNDEKENSMYAAFIARLRVANPNLRCLGLSATVFRMGSGLLYEGKNRLFEGLAYEYTIADGVRDGYLVPLISKASLVQGDTSNIGISQGDFKIAEAENEFDRQALTEKALDEVFKYGADRKAWVFFCITVKHAEHVRDALRLRGVTAECVSDKTPSAQRKHILTDYKAGKIRALCSVNIVAVGFNATCVDLIAVLRPTLSPGWHIQALGRGTRLHPGKKNCLVLCFAGNLERLGPVTHVVPPPRGKRPSKEDNAGRVCPKCESVSGRDAKECEDCGFQFPIIARKVKHSRVATTVDAMSDEPLVSNMPIWLDVKAVHYEIHKKVNSANTLKCLYRTQAQWIIQWVAFASDKVYARQKAAEWWKARAGLSPVPVSADEALRRIDELGSVKTSRIRVKKEGKYFNILAYDLIAQTSNNLSSGNLGASHVNAS